ncbi:MAG: bifunctional hydroxymethylpyrimidine kinase/phosphomethylpyrimidine kinase [Candidatus Marinimicrobia bacterium]|nr:bifunctional hydroxymethylpyrimidine kinase/phosphomethylpyrimidine kinase [Candidatus Neomarinimicrobiota bacterium]
MSGRVLIVAGSDSGGGAGIQADIKTVTALGGYAMSAITAVTVQNTKKVSAVHEIPADIVAAQIIEVVRDLGADIVKIGMLSSVSVIESVHNAFNEVGPRIPRVVDPVMRSKGGHVLLAASAAKACAECLIKGAALVTPNLPEAEVLTGLKIKTLADMEAAVDDLRGLGAQAVLLKGGHLEENHLVDLLITADKVVRFEDQRIDTRSTHGTGCTLASAIAVGLAAGQPLVESVSRARSYVRKAIKTAPGLGQGHGPLNHGHTVMPFLHA